MPRPIWKGAVTFGLVTIPVRLHVATERKDVAFHLLHAEDHVRIKQLRYCSEHDRVLDANEIVKGYEIAPDQYVVLTEEDFEKVPVSSTRAIEITDFVQAEEIDPIYYERAYYLEPEAVAKKPFALLLKTLQETNRVAVASITIRQKEHLCTLRPFENTIAVETMLYADEIRSTSDLDLPGEDIEVSERELAMARSLVDMLSGPFQPEKYHDSYREALLGLIQAKAEGQEIVSAAPAPPKVTDLMEALRASIEAAKRERGPVPEAVERPLRKKAG